MNEHDDAYVDAMLMVNMQANTRSVTALPLTKISSRDLKDIPLFIEGGVSYLQIVFPFPSGISLTLVVPHNSKKFDHSPASNSMKPLPTNLLLPFYNHFC